MLIGSRVQMGLPLLVLKSGIKREDIFQYSIVSSTLVGSIEVRYPALKVRSFSLLIGRPMASFGCVLLTGLDTVSFKYVE